jgi:hypothetical protein
MIYIEQKDDISEEENKFIFSKVHGFEFLLYILQTFTEESDADVINVKQFIFKITRACYTFYMFF